ncbi:MAG: hypothetical protein J0652_08265 [Desulfobulbaceae bacterium]|jgi:hypothetical protein|nr:hypothetical protein [Desulfobulbaceae bacterium]
MRNITAIMIILATVSMYGCAGMTNTEQKTLSGAGIGAGGGAVLGIITGGSPVVGAVVGGGVGAVTGHIIGENDKK